VLNRESQDVVAPEVGQIRWQVAPDPSQPEGSRRFDTARQPFQPDADDGEWRIGRAPGPQVAPGVDLDPPALRIGQRDAGVRCPMGGRIGQAEDVPILAGGATPWYGPGVR